VLSLSMINIDIAHLLFLLITPCGPLFLPSFRLIVIDLCQNLIGAFDCLVTEVISVIWTVTLIYIKKIIVKSSKILP
jgi:hypothetical protein